MYDGNEKYSRRGGGWLALVLGLVVMVALSFWLSPSASSSLTWYNLLMPSVWALFAAAFVMVIVILIMTSIVGLRYYGVSIGMLGNRPLFVGRYWSLYVGWLPIADLSFPTVTINRKGAYWSITALPSLIMVVVGFVMMEICRRDAAGMTEMVPVLNISAGSLLGLFALACIVNAIFLELMHIDRLKDVFPQVGCVYSFSQIMILAAVVYLYPLFLDFFKENVLGVTP